MKITKAQARKWSKALRSGEYKQTRCSLQDACGYCCLGVACIIFIPKSKLNFRYNNNNIISGGFPGNQSYSPTWLSDINRDLEELLGDSFSELNDNKKATFDEIADVIDMVYVLRLLD